MATDTTTAPEKPAAVVGDLRGAGRREIECDLICPATGFEPAAGLVAQAGGYLRVEGERRLGLGELPPGVLAAGEVTGLEDLSAVVASGRLAGAKAALAVLGPVARLRARIEELEDAAARRWPCLLPLRVVMNWGMPMLDLPVIEALVTRHPRVTWILSGINYLHELQLAVSLMRRHATVHLETSCVMGYAAIEKLIGQVGAERLLFGSGALDKSPGAAKAFVDYCTLPEEDKQKIAGHNLARLLKLDSLPKPYNEKEVDDPILVLATWNCFDPRSRYVCCVSSSEPRASSLD